MATPTTLPSTFAASSVLTSTQMNDLRGAFRILQVVQAVKTDAATGTVGTSNVDLTGLSVSITPSATSSKVLIFAQIGVTCNDGGGLALTLVRDSTAVGLGDTAGSRRLGTINAPQALGGGTGNHVVMYLDSPATTSATTYKIQASADTAGVTFFINRSTVDTDSNVYVRSASTLIAMEVSA